MIITYASHHSWYKPTTIEAINHYGKNDRKRLIKTLQSMPQAGVTYEISPASESFFEWFKPLYEGTIGSKRNAALHDVAAILEHPRPTSLGYYTFTLKEQGVPIGGCIFSDFGWYYSIAYRMYKYSWHDNNLPASPALLGEFLLDDYAYQHGKKMLKHGRDRNPYGINSSIGLSIFKLAAGCRAMTALTHEVRLLDTTTITEDALVLHKPQAGRHITEATLLCTESSLPKHEQLFKYPDRLSVTTLLR